MKRTISPQTTTRHLLPSDFSLSTWDSVKPYFDQLSEVLIHSAADLRVFCGQRSELESYLSENFAWRYIKMSCDNQNEELQASYAQFVNDIMPHASVYEDVWNKKVMDSPYGSKRRSRFSERKIFPCLPNSKTCKPNMGI
jgi:oligoendopeptidase F